MSLKENFDNISKYLAIHAEELNHLSNTEKLEIYGYYKQGAFGDCNIDRPGMMKYKERAKWDAWNSRKGISKEESMEKYIQLVKIYLPNCKHLICN